MCTAFITYTTYTICFYLRYFCFPVKLMGWWKVASHDLHMCKKKSWTVFGNEGLDYVLHNNTAAAAAILLGHPRDIYVIWRRAEKREPSRGFPYCMFSGFRVSMCWRCVLSRLDCKNKKPADELMQQIVAVVSLQVNTPTSQLQCLWLVRWRWHAGWWSNSRAAQQQPILQTASLFTPSTKSMRMSDADRSGL